ncbi:MAG: type I methionyl aminopeptidase [Candidatus Pacebacteria bacterium]|nr:type I methionyl aminopeptidase [Candidatus Paceibacterota bacterium]
MATTKTPEEIVILREGGKRLARLIELVKAETKVGVPIRDLDALFEREARAAGDAPAFLGYTPAGAERPFPASLCVSVNDEAVHGVPTESDYVLQDGDIVSLDAGLTHQGLITDMCTTVAVGDVDEIGLELIEVAKRALMVGIHAARGGDRLGDIGAAIDAELDGTGFGAIPDLGGHGVGHKVHEAPHIFHFGEAGTGAKLVPGMVITIEPTVSEGSTDIELAEDGYTYKTIDGSRTAQFEHTIVITNGEPEILTLP